MPDINMWKARQALLQKKADLILAAADRRDPPGLADEEKAELTALEKEIDNLSARIERAASDASLMAEVEKLAGRHGLGTSGSGGRSAGSSSPGALFAEGTAEFFKAAGHRSSGTWRSPAVEIPYASLFAATVSEDPASGGKLVVPAYQPGIQPMATRPIVVMDLLMPGSTDSNVVTYMQETTFTNAAAPVAEGALKPESALVFNQVNEPVCKIAHWLPATDEILEDVPGLRSYIDGRMRTGVQLAEDDQVLNGNGTAPNFRGILNRVGLATTVVQGAGEAAADAILRQIGAIATTALVAPTGIAMNPADWFAMQILKTTTGEYIGASPFETPAQPSLWGLPVALTSAIVAKTALVGAFATQAQFFRRGGLRVDASNSHADFYIRNLLAIRAEERGALAVYRPAAFGKVTLL